MNSSRSSSSDAPAAHHFVVAPAAGGSRLDKALAEQPGVPSREAARRLIVEGRVTVNGRPGEPDTRVQPGDAVAYTVPPPAPYHVPAEHTDLDILYEDDALLVVNKPPGMPMHPGPGHRTGTLVNYLLGHCGDRLSGVGGVARPGIVHRLDKDTSGVVVVAKHDAAHLALAAQFKARTIQRTYYAVLVGRPPRDSGVVDLPVARERENRMRRTVRDDGKHAVTRWWVERRLGPFTLVRLKLETGRTHQIRVHMAHEGWPLLGDPLYGRARHRGLALPPEVGARLDAFRRQALHATELGFTHPESGQALHFTTPLPPDMHDLVAFLAESAETPAGR